ncbi:hypothetical protein D6D29_10319 [Aureobasidium pullulans]|nr:hypothetical protein D6D29_10319 [Aureobasidium pullulans]
MSIPSNNLLSGLHLSDDDVPVPRVTNTSLIDENNHLKNQLLQRDRQSDSASLSDENIHLKNQLLLRDRQIDQLAARLEALERHPPEFDNDKVDFGRWPIKMRLKLDCQLDSHSERFEIQYIMSRTAEGPIERLHARATRLTSAEDCLSQLNDCYGERHRESRAWNELSNLHQTGTFADFFAHFQELLAYVTLPESVQIDLVLEKLSFRYADKVEDGTSYDSLRQLIHRCYTLDAGFAREDARNNAFHDDYDTDEFDVEIQAME